MVTPNGEEKTHCGARLAAPGSAGPFSHALNNDSGRKQATRTSGRWQRASLRKKLLARLANSSHVFCCLPGPTSEARDEQPLFA
jgi:hypothetical protein